MDIQRWIEAEYQVRYHERTIGKLLHTLNLSHVSTRPFHAKSDVEVQAAFKKTSRPRSRRSSPDMPPQSASKSGFRTKPASARKGPSYQGAELNPQENIWQYLRQNALANRAYETYDNIVTACCKAWNDLINLPDTIKSIASREWFQCVSS